MISSWVIWSLWIIILAVAAVLTSSSILLLVMIVCAAIMLSVIIIYRFMPINLKTKFDIPYNASKESTVYGDITITNESLMPYSRILAKVRIENILTHEIKYVSLISSIDARGTASFKLKYKERFCGNIEMSIESIRVYDLFCLTYKTSQLTAKRSTVILPDVYDIEVILEASSGFNPENEEYSKEKSGFDFSETYDFRDYIPGDSPKQIHWKLSQKHDRLIVREGSLPMEKSVLLLLETSVNKGSAMPSAKDVSAMAEAMCSLSQSLCEKDIFHRIAWVDQRTEKLRFYDISNEDDLTGILPKLLGAGCGYSDSKVVECYEKEVSDIEFSHIVCIQSKVSETPEASGRTTLIVCGDDVSSDDQMTAFSAETAPEDLAIINI